MNVTDLIATAAARRIEKDPQLLGIRVCPVALTPADVEPLRKSVHAVLGDATYVAVSIPGAARLESSRLFVSPDKAAAERATLWRNEVKIDDGEHLLYVSVQTHGKAGGLQECLTQLREDDLREEFALWCDEKGSGMPAGVGAALRDSGILGRVSVQALCEYANAVLRDRRESKWESCGHHLPLLNLARDVGLRSGNAANRLAENEKTISRAATGERAAGQGASLAQVRDAFTAAAGDVRDRLRRIDLTQHLDDALKKRGGGRKEPRKAEKQRGAAKKTQKKPARKTNKPKVDPNEALVNIAQNAGAKGPLDAIERKAGKIDLAQGGVSDPPGGQIDAGGGDGADQVWTRAQQIKEFGALAERVPLGLGAMLIQSLQGDGYGLRWEARDSASALFEDLPAHAVPAPQRGPISDPAVQSALVRVVAARKAAANLLLPDGDKGLKALSTFIKAPLVALAERRLREVVAALLAAWADLYEASTHTADAAARRAALAMDTLEVRAKSGDAMMVVGPLHPLWLSQAIGRFEALLEKRDLSATAKRLLVRSLSEAPAAPEGWPLEEGRALQLSRPVGGLITYQSTPEELDPEDVKEAAAGVLRLYCETSPHAVLGLRVAVLGGDASPIIDGAADVVADDARLSVTVHHSHTGQSGASERTDRVFADGRLALGALPATPDGATLAPPHIVFHQAPANAPGVSLQPAAPAQPGLGASSGLLPTVFTVVQGGLRARTPIDRAKFPALAAFEAVHALVGGGQPQGAFSRNAWAVSLRSLLADERGASTRWDVILAPRIGRRTPQERFLLAHDRPTERLSVSIVSREIAPAARVMKDALQTLGVQELRPSVLTNLAKHLAAITSQGIISPYRTHEQVLAAGILGMALKRECAGAESFVAHCEGSSAATLLGQDPATLDGAFAIGFGASGDKLKIILGYAALRAQLDADVKGSQLTGPLGDTLTRLASAIELACRTDGVGSIAAREALNWLLWPALAAAEVPGSKTESLLVRLDQGVGAELSVVAYLPPNCPATKRRTAIKLGNLPASVHPLDVTTFQELVFGNGGAAAMGR